MIFNYVSHSKLQYTVNKLLALINAGGGGGSVDVSGKEDSLEIESVSGSVSTLSAQTGKYYRWGATAVNSLTITLPSMSTSVTKPQGFMMLFFAGSSPSITIQSAGNQTIQYFENYAVKASKWNEINCLWNGHRWIIAYGIIG